MKNLMFPILFVLALTGCSAVTPGNNPNQPTQPSVSNTQTPTPAGSTALSEPQVIKVRPPMIPIGPVQGTPGLPAPALGPHQGWQTFTSTALGTAVDYPVDWSVAENGAGAKFGSPQGDIILLEREQSNPNSVTTGQACTILTNSYGQTADICFDAATFTYRAVFKKPADASTAWLALSTISREKPTIFLQMFDTLRSVP